MPEPATKLADDQIEFFRDNGFLTLEAITTKDEVGRMREIYDRLFEQRVGWDRGSQFDLAGTDEDGQPRLPQLLAPSTFEPQLKDTLYRKNAQAIARQLLGDDMQDKVNEHMIYKPPRIGAETPWHQDQAYHDPNYYCRSVNFWMPLDDVTIESGCLQFVPGSHKSDVLPHHSIGHNPRIHGLEVDDPQQRAEKAVACPVPAGGATLHAAYMLHYAGPNHTDIPRRAYTLVFRQHRKQRDVPCDNYWIRERRTARDERAQTSAGEG